MYLFRTGVTLAINRMSPHSFKEVALSWLFSAILSLICISQERERDISYIRYAQRLFVLFLRAEIILSWETEVHESQSTTKIIV